MLKEEFLARMKKYLGAEYDDFLLSYQADNIRGLRLNSQYIDDENFALIRDFSCEKINNVKDGYVVLEDIKFGFHPLHHSGMFYLQDPSAMIPALALEIPTDAKVLDLCASPGGKSSQLASFLTNGVLYANEIDNKRVWSLYSNIERLAYRNVIVTNNDSKDYLKNFQNYFDVILVDAPCSGEGMFRKYPEAVALWSEENIFLCQKRDKEILTNAMKLLKQGGKLIYSTCTFAKEENEEIVSYLCENGFKTLPIKSNLLPYVKEGFLPNTYRIYPHHHFGEGQFICVLEKTASNEGGPKLTKKNSLPSEFKKFCEENLTLVIDNVLQKNDEIFYAADNTDLSNLKVLNYGVKLGKIQNKRFIPDHHFFKAFAYNFKKQITLDFHNPLVAKYLHGEQIEYPIDNGYGVIILNGMPLGGFKATNNKLNNYYPKGLRNF